MTSPTYHYRLTAKTRAVFPIALLIKIDGDYLTLLDERTAERGGPGVVNIRGEDMSENDAGRWIDAGWAVNDIGRLT